MPNYTSQYVFVASVGLGFIKRTPFIVRSIMLPFAGEANPSVAFGKVWMLQEVAALTVSFAGKVMTAVRDSIHLILASRPPSKIFKPVIGRVSVQMPSDLAGPWLTNKRCQYKPVDAESPKPCHTDKSDAKVSFWVWARSANLAFYSVLAAISPRNNTLNRANAPEVTDLVGALVSRNVKPFLIHIQSIPYVCIKVHP